METPGDRPEAGFPVDPKPEKAREKAADAFSWKDRKKVFA
jgi:hypothetical protein